MLSHFPEGIPYRCPRPERAGRDGWGVLVLVALAQFIVILDTTTYSVAFQESG
jgi:hypothetical protein